MGDYPFRQWTAEWWADQKDTLRIIRRYWWLFALLVLAFGGVQLSLHVRIESQPAALEAGGHQPE